MSSTYEIQPLFFAGDLILVRGQDDKLFKITKANPVKLKIKDEQGKNYECNRSAALPAPSGSVWAPVETQQPEYPEVTCGAVVEFTGTTRAKIGGGRWVALRPLENDRFLFAPLNGGKDMPQWKVHVSSCTIVEV